MLCSSSATCRIKCQAHVGDVSTRAKGKKRIAPWALWSHTRPERFPSHAKIPQPETAASISASWVTASSTSALCRSYTTKEHLKEKTDGVCKQQCKNSQLPTTTPCPVGRVWKEDQKWCNTSTSSSQTQPISLHIVARRTKVKARECWKYTSVCQLCWRFSWP